MTHNPNSLTPAEVTALANREASIEAGIETFVEVANALIDIRDARLYRETLATFEEYCRQRWGFSDRSGRHLIAAADIGPIARANDEGQASEPMSFKDNPDALRRLWADLLKHGEMLTAAHVREAVERHCRPPEATPAERAARRQRRIKSAAAQAAYLIEGVRSSAITGLREIGGYLDGMRLDDDEYETVSEQLYRLLDDISGHAIELLDGIRTDIDDEFGRLLGGELPPAHGEDDD